MINKLCSLLQSASLIMSHSHSGIPKSAETLHARNGLLDKRAYARNGLLVKRAYARNGLLVKSAYARTIIARPRDLMGVLVNFN